MIEIIGALLVITLLGSMGGILLLIWWSTKDK